LKNFKSITSSNLGLNPILEKKMGEKKIVLDNTSTNTKIFVVNSSHFS